MKTVLVIGAMEEEISPLVSGGDYEKKDAVPFTYYLKNDGKTQVVVTVSKVGKVAMAACVQHFITLIGSSPEFAGHTIDLVINTGVAGAISSKLNQGDIVVGGRLCQHDMDVTGLGYEIGLNPDYDSVYFETDASVVNMVKNAYESLDADYSLMVGTIASGDQFISSREKKEFIESGFGALACEMEGASLAQVCSDNGVPFLVIRAISDKADGEAPLSYNDFKEKAIVNLTELLKKVI